MSRVNVPRAMIISSYFKRHACSEDFRALHAHALLRVFTCIFNSLCWFLRLQNEQKLVTGISSLGEDGFVFPAGTERPSFLYFFICKVVTMLNLLTAGEDYFFKEQQQKREREGIWTSYTSRELNNDCVITILFKSTWCCSHCHLRLGQVSLFTDNPTFSNLEICPVST